MKNFNLTKETEPNEFDIYLTNFKGADLGKVASNLYELFHLFTSETEYKKCDPFAQEPLPAIFTPLQKK